jgi:serine/threonine-protein kinase
MQDPNIGDELDGYRLTELLARGGMASVFKATDLGTGQEVVLKIPYIQYESDVVFYQRFLREEQIGQRIQHPGIVRVLAPREKSRLYLAMEFVPGRSLADVLAAERPFGAERAISIACQLGEALSCLQGQGITHRDVKPGNVRVLPSGDVKLLDFGIALIESARRLTWAGLSHAVGTPDYMAPEQIRGRRGDARTDVYALGTLLYEMLTGHLPHEAGDTGAILESKLHGVPTAPSVHLPGLDPALEAIVLRAISQDPRDRYPGALEMVRDLRCPSAATIPTPPRAQGARLSTRNRRRITATLILGVIILGLASLAWLSRPGAAPAEVQAADARQ